jgi:FkbM family methyltransferase
MSARARRWRACLRACSAASAERYDRTVDGHQLITRFNNARYWWRASRDIATLGGRFRLAAYAVTTRPALALLGKELTVTLRSGQVVQLRPDSTDRRVFQQVLIWRQYDFDYPEPVRVIVDAGANIGLSSLWFANRFPDATVVTLELEQQNFARLTQNVAAEANVVPVHAALRPDNRPVAVVAGDGEWSFRAESGRDIAAVTVGELITRYGPIDILKLDIEGGERDLLAGSADWIANVRTLVGELHPDLEPDVADVFAAATAGFATRRSRRELEFVTR